MKGQMKIKIEEATITSEEDLDGWVEFIKLCFRDIMSQKNAPAVIINCELIESKEWTIKK